MLVVPLLALSFGGKSSTGLLLPMLVMADLMAVRYYKRDAVWKYLQRLMPAAVAGVLLGVYVGDRIDDETFKRIISLIVIVGLVLLILLERYPMNPKKMEHPLFGILMGLLGGFCTMIGNAAGPIMAVYLLSVRLPKNAFIGTAAFFFLFINLFKLPFHFLVWKTITPESLWLDLWGLPLIVLGFLIGVRIVKWIPEKAFRYFVIIMTGLVAIKLLLS